MRNINIIFKINGNSSYINKKIDIIVLEKIILWTLVFHMSRKINSSFSNYSIIILTSIKSI